LEKKDGGNGKQKYFEKGQVQKAYIFFHLPISSCFFVTLNTWYHLVIFLGEGERDDVDLNTVNLNHHWWPLESWDLTMPQITKKELSGDSIQCKNLTHLRKILNFSTEYNI